MGNIKKKKALQGAFFVLSHTKQLIALLLLIFLLGACSRKSDINTHLGFSMGTSYTVKWVSVAHVDNAFLTKHIDQLLFDVEDRLSTYITTSEVSQINQSQPKVWHEVSLPTAKLIEQAQTISQTTAGMFDITLGAAVNAWGFGPHGIPDKIPTSHELEQIRTLVGYDKLHVRLDNPAIKKQVNSYIDLSAIAKGYGVDVVAEWLIENNVTNFLVEIGGEVRTQGRKPNQQPWRIAIESPALLERNVYKIVEINDRALATSGNYRNYYEIEDKRYSHTLHPTTLRPVDHKLASVTVMANTATYADALATALMVMGEKVALEWAQSNGITAYFIVSDGDTFIATSTGGFDQFIQS